MSIFQIILEGVLYGLTLSIMLGPIFIALTQAGLEKGLRAGLLVGLGIWISDVIIIWGLISFINSISLDFFEGDFKRNFGLGGGVILILFGLFMALKKQKELSSASSLSVKSIGGFFMKGFLVNTINPFTFMFWTTLITTYVVGKSFSNHEVNLFFGAIILTIMITDSLKVVSAKLLRKNLNQDNIIVINRIAGIGLIGFGIALIFRSWV